MIRAFLRLFARRDLLSRLSRQDNRAAFIGALIEAEVTVVAALTTEGLDMDSFTEDELLAELDRNHKHLGERDTFEPLIYLDGNLRCIPFFSTAGHMEAFCAEYSRVRSRVFPFSTVTTHGSALASLLTFGEALVLNPGTPDEYQLTSEDVGLLEKAMGEG